METKTVFNHKSDCAIHNEPYMPNGKCNCLEQIASEKYPIDFLELPKDIPMNETFAMVQRDAFIAGYTAAQSEQSEMVKKSEVVELIQKTISFFELTSQIEDLYGYSNFASQILTELLTKLKDL